MVTNVFTFLPSRAGLSTALHNSSLSQPRTNGVGMTPASKEAIGQKIKEGGISSYQGCNDTSATQTSSVSSTGKLHHTALAFLKKKPAPPEPTKQHIWPCHSVPQFSSCLPHRAKAMSSCLATPAKRAGSKADPLGRSVRKPHELQSGGSSPGADGIFQSRSLSPRACSASNRRRERKALTLISQSLFWELSNQTLETRASSLHGTDPLPKACFRLLKCPSNLA